MDPTSHSRSASVRNVAFSGYYKGANEQVTDESMSSELTSYIKKYAMTATTTVTGSIEAG